MREEQDATSLAETQPTDNDSRLSIWTIRTEWIGWFYALFVLQAVPLIYALWWSEKYSGAHDNIASTITAVAGGSASLIFVAAIATIIELEAAMVLRQLLIQREARKEREKLRAELERGIEIGRQLEREEQAARRNGNNRNGEQED